MALRTSELGKRYFISRIATRKQANRSRTIFDCLPRSGLKGARKHEFWALRKLSIELEQGAVLGVLGKNGAGKTTLLKILSRITHPTEGVAEVSGRVGSLLEVGTGFHPELSGRENIFLNGSILGMKRREIQSQLEEIIEFAGVETFIDTPVKRYSSGMYMRLAFSVAAHLRTDILFVDEVLAVGDYYFQQKCLEKMDSLGTAGRTIILVSHNLNAVKELCDRAILLEHGKLSAFGSTPEVIQTYLTKEAQSGATQYELSTENGSLHQVSLSSNPLTFGENLTITIEYRLPELLENPQFAIAIQDYRGQRVTSLINDWSGTAFPKRLQGEGAVTCTILSTNLMPGDYLLEINLWASGRLIDSGGDNLGLRVNSTTELESLGRWNQLQGNVIMNCKWNYE